MPVFEYRCNDCSEKFEVFVKSASKQYDVNCPKCKSADNNKLFSSFAAQAGDHSHDFGGCESGSCGMPSSRTCANGMCGLN